MPMPAHSGNIDATESGPGEPVTGVQLQNIYAIQVGPRMLFTLFYRLLLHSSIQSIK